MVADKKALWRFRHAQQCFEYAATTSGMIIREKWPLDHPLIYQISIAIVVLYARPFTNCYGLGSLGQDFVPSEYRSKHERLMAMRHRVFAHYDVTDHAAPATVDLTAEMRFNLTGSKLILELKETPLINEAFDQVKELSEALEKKCRWQIEKIVNKYKKGLPKKDGVYKFDLRDEKKFLGNPAS